ncbi:septum formation family protein [Micromonospora sp. CA-249363]|uniref:septum formation family protein n=1 Tax=Micromonospora sp. CA-249363 TaxID=3239963 RepID=UPI003D9378F0
MRRLWGTTVLVALTVGVSGCDSGPSEQPTSTFAPEAGACHATASDDRSPEAYAPIPCSSKHEAETFLVGLIRGTDGAASAPPAADTEAMWRLHDACDSEAARFLGGEWRESRLAMRALTPSAARWKAGERWYRCDLVEMLALDRWVPNPRANSLRAALTADSPLRLTCFTEPEEDGDALVDLPPASCTGPHGTEFAGIWPAGPEVEELTEEVMEAGCRSTIAQYVGAPETALKGRLEVLAYVAEAEPEWLAGRLSAMCFLYSPNQPLDRSLKNAGRSALPAAR